MKVRSLEVWLAGLALLGTGAAVLFAQPPQPAASSGAAARTGRDKVRAQVITLRTEVEMLRLDYELAREGLLEELKMSRGLKMAGGLIGFGVKIQNAMNQGATNAPATAPPPESEQDRRKAADEAKAAEQEEKKQAAMEAAYVAERKQELSRLFALMEAKRLDLEDAERHYRELSR